MKNTYLKIVLTVTAFLEISVGLLMIINPSFFNEVCGIGVESLSRSFAVGAIAIGLLALLCLLFFQKVNLFIPILILGIYNLGIAIVQFYYPVEGVPSFVPVLFHLFISASFLYFSVPLFSKLSYDEFKSTNLN